MRLRSEERRESERLGDIVLWSHIVAAPAPSPRSEAPSSPTVIQNKDGALMATLRYRGPDVTMMDYTEWALYLEGWNRLIKRLGSGWALWADEWHEVARDYPQSVWTNPAGYFLDSIRKTIFAQGQFFETQQFLTLTWQPPSTRKQYWYDSIFVKRAHGRLQQEDALQLQQYIGALEKFADALSHLLPLCAWCTPKETLTYLHRCVSWDRHPVGMPERAEDLDLRLGTGTLTHGFTPVLSGQYLRPIGVRSWPGALGMTIPATLQQLALPYRFTVRYLCLDATAAKKILNGMRRRWEVQVLPLTTHLADAWNGTTTDWQDPTANVNEEAREHAYALQRAVSAISSEDLAYGYCSPTILLWANSEAELARRERAVIKLLQGDEFILHPEDKNASKAWMSTLPGDAYSNVRNPPLSTRTFAFLLPHGAVWTGEPWDRHFNGPPLLTASSNGQPFWFTLHQGEAASTMILGPRRMGKSGLLALMGMQALRYAGMQLFAWDRDYSLYCATKMAGGAHYHLGAEGKGFQPLGDLDTPEQIRWRQEWLQDLFSAEGVPTTIEDRQAIWDALVHLATQPRRERRLSLFTRYLQVHRLKHALQPYCQGGRFDCFDAAEDSFELGAAWTTFEMATLLDLPAHVCALALQYQFHEIERCFTGAPTLLLIDEAWQVAKHQTFWPKLFLYLKAAAKKNVSVILSTQEVTDMRDTALWQALLGSISNWIFLPNKQAMNQDVLPQYEACGLSPAHIQHIALMQEFRDYLLKAGTNVRVFQCAFDKLERCFVAASRQEEIRELQALDARALEEPLQAAWLRSQGFNEAADLYVEYLTERQEVGA